MRPAPIMLLLVLTASLACDRRRAPDPRPMVQRAMRGVIVYPRSAAVNMTAGADAAQVTFSSPDSVATVARWFRTALQLNGWALQSDLTANDGSVSIVAMQDARPLWVTLRPNVGAPGTTYTVIGAVITEGDSLRMADSVK